MGLPPKQLIQAGRFTWTTLWSLMMGQMAPSDRQGHYQRPNSQFREKIDPQAKFPPEKDRYGLIVGLGCPWAHRTLVTRALKGLEEVIAVEVVVPAPEEGGWIFSESDSSFRTLRDFYLSVNSSYSGRFTVPVLWDRASKSIVNNESSDIIVMLNQDFSQLAKNSSLDLYPESVRSDIDRWNDEIYDAVNNGVYKCGFAQTQAAYDEACTQLFDTLDKIEQTLALQRFLCGDTVTLADVRLFTTLFRFDSVYFSLFKCNRRLIKDYSNLSGYLKDLYQMRGVQETCDLNQVKQDYYGNLFPLNPGGIIPQGPDMSYLLQPHGRDRF